MADVPLARRAVDELEIRNLLTRLAHLAGEDDLDEYGSLFTEDAVWEGPSGPGPFGGTFERVLNGRADILAGARERRAAGMQGRNANVRHVVTNTVVWLHGDTAKSKSFYLYLVNTHMKPEVDRMGVYHDELRRTPDGWKMARRVIVNG